LIAVCKQLSVIAIVASLAVASDVRAGIVFTANFDSAPTFGAGVGGGFSGITTTEGVQGYAGIGTGTDVFSGNFLRNKTGGSPDGTPGLKTTLSLNNLPTHTGINLQFLLAIIDS